MKELKERMEEDDEKKRCKRTDTVYLVILNKMDATQGASMFGSFLSAI